MTMNYTKKRQNELIANAEKAMSRAQSKWATMNWIVTGKLRFH